MRNKSFVSSTNRYGMEEEKYSTVRKLASSNSSNALLRGYNHSIIASSNNSSSNTNSGTVNSKHTNERNGFFFFK